MAEKLPGIERPELQALPQIGDRMTFLYLEHCQLNREDGAILIRDARGTTAAPAAGISVLLLGPGTNVTHRAMELIGNTGVSVVWVGEHGVRYYAGGRPLTHRSRLLLRQAELVSNQRKHLAVARRMYEMRFPGEDVSAMTMQQLRGKEGSRVRKIYRQASKQWNIPWSGREFDPNDYQGGSKVNQALSAGNACLYGLALAVIAALGCSPGLGFSTLGMKAPLLMISLFPAHAGVIPVGRCRSSFDLTFPRTRGGDPYGFIQGILTAYFSPRRRG